MVVLTAAGDTCGDLAGIPTPRVAGCGPNPDAAAPGHGEAGAARVEVRPASAGAVEIALRGELGCGDAAVLSCQLHHSVDLGATMITVDARAVTGCAPGLAQVLSVAAARAQAAHIALRVVDPEGRLRHHNTTHRGHR
jgi:hypothetical protein